MLDYKLGAKDVRTLSVEVFSSCHLSTYPYVIARDKASGRILGRGDLNSFGQRANTIDTYTVPISDNAFDLEDLELVMFSSMDEMKNVISNDLIAEDSKLDITALERHVDPDYLIVSLAKNSSTYLFVCS